MKNGEKCDIGRPALYNHFNHGQQRTRDPTRYISTWIQIQSFSCETIQKGNFTNILYMNIASNTMLVFPRILLIFFYLFFISLNFYFFFFFIFWLIIRDDVDCTIFLYKWPSYHWLSTDAIPTCMVYIYLTRVMYFTQPWR